MIKCNLQFVPHTNKNKFWAFHKSQFYTSLAIDDFKQKRRENTVFRSKNLAILLMAYVDVLN